MKYVYFVCYVHTSNMPQALSGPPVWGFGSMEGKFAKKIDSLGDLHPILDAEKREK